MSICVMQLKCTGGTAGCSAFIPQVVQCYNRGTDGTEVQVGTVINHLIHSSLYHVIHRPRDTSCATLCFIVHFYC